MLGADTMPCKHLWLSSVLCVSFATVAAVLDWQGGLEVCTTTDTTIIVRMCSSDVIRCPLMSVVCVDV
jgi:hypothetical protein